MFPPVPIKPRWEDVRAMVQFERVQARRAYVRKLARCLNVGGCDDAGQRPLRVGDRLQVIWWSGLPAIFRFGAFERAPLHVHPLFPFLSHCPGRN